MFIFYSGIITRFARFCKTARRRAFFPRVGGAFCLAAALLAAGCAYKSEIRQGNDMLPQKIAKLRPGMSREEVRALLGENRAPAFFAEGESQFYYFRRRNSGFFTDWETWSVELVFDGNTLAEIKSTPPLEELPPPETAENAPEPTESAEQ